MGKKVVCLFIISLFLSLSCNKGLFPPESQTSENTFPILPLGGDPSGRWQPDPDTPVELIILDESKIPALLDSFSFDVQLEGSFRFENGICDVQALMTITARAYLIGQTTPLVLAFPDTITGTGPYLIEDNALQAPIQSTQFNFATLGYTSSDNSLLIISLHNEFRYEIFSIPIYFVFHLIRENENVPATFHGSYIYHQREEGVR